MSEEHRKEDNGFNEWKRYILMELTRLGDGQEKMDDKLEVIHTDVTTLKVKAGVWGFIAGAIPSTVGIVWMWLTK